MPITNINPMAIVTTLLGDRRGSTTMQGFASNFCKAMNAPGRSPWDYDRLGGEFHVNENDREKSRHSSVHPQPNNPDEIANQAKRMEALNELREKSGKWSDKKVLVMEGLSERLNADRHRAGKQ